MTDAFDYSMLTTIFAILLGMMALLKYVFYLIDRREGRLEERINHLDSSVKSLTATVNDVEDDIEGLKSTIKVDHSDYKHLKEDIGEVKTTVDKVFNRVDGLSSKLNQVIGATEGHVLP